MIWLQKELMNHTECLLQGQNTEFLLRQDNADERLTRKAYETRNCVREKESCRLEEKELMIKEVIDFLSRNKVLVLMR